MGSRTRHHVLMPRPRRSAIRSHPKVDTLEVRITLQSLCAGFVESRQNDFESAFDIKSNPV